jgi:hypothetical protein
LSKSEQLSIKSSKSTNFCRTFCGAVAFKEN